MRCSAIVVTYNSGAAITACLEALTREDCEIIVVDNASADDTVQRVEEFVAWNPLQGCWPTRKIAASAQP